MKNRTLVILVVAALAGFLSDGDFDPVGPRTARAEENTRLGERVYRQSCVACHGERGDGKGPEAHRMQTKPRDFTAGIYKFRSTPTGSLPLDQDIARTIAKGVRGTSMLAQRHLSADETWAVAQYLKTFSPRFEEESPMSPVPLPPRPAAGATLIDLGKKTYEEAGCATCHGIDGKGNGPSAGELEDVWRNPIRPTDLTRKPFKSGSSAADLYRTLSTGLDGTPMPSYGDVLSPEQTWALADYILSIAREAPRGRGMMGMMDFVGEERLGMMIDMPAAMGGMMRGRGMGRHRRGMMQRNMQEMMEDMMGR